MNDLVESRRERHFKAVLLGRIGIAEVDGLGDASVLALSDRIAGVARDGRPKASLSITVERTDGRSVAVEATDPSRAAAWRRPVRYGSMGP